MCLIPTLAMLVSPARASNLILNGSFDVTGTTTGSFSNTGQTATLPGWVAPVRSDNNQITCVVPGSATAAPNLICIGTGATQTQPKFSVWAAPGPSPNGGNYFLEDGWTTGQVALSQTVTGLKVGHTYQLSFWQASAQEDCLFDDGTSCDPTVPPLNTETEQWQVTFGATTINSTLMTTPIHTSIPWNEQIMNFTATSTSQLISFLALGTPTNGPPLVLLDGIDLEETPEPGSGALIALGLLLCLPLGRMFLRKRPKHPPLP